MIPRSRLPAAVLLSKSRPFLSWPRESMPGRLLAAAMLEAWSGLPTMPSDQAPMVAEALVGLLDGIMRNELAGQTKPVLDVPMVQAMRFFVEQRLGDPDLSAEAMAGAFGCSRATVYRLFKPEDGVQSFVRDRRLSQCYRTLAQGNGDRLSVEAVAAQWGFRSASQLRPAFKKRYGVTPTDVANRLPGDGRGGPATDLIGPEHAEHIRRLHSWAGLPDPDTNGDSAS